MQKPCQSAEKTPLPPNCNKKSRVFCARRSTAGVFAPCLVILLTRRCHRFRCAEQPFFRLLDKMALNVVNNLGAAKMHVSCFPAHRPQQAQTIFFICRRLQRDRDAVRGQTPQDPLAAQLHIRIPAAHGLREDCLIQDFRRPRLFDCPQPGGRNQRFGFTRDLAALPLRQPDKALMA